jgi:LPS export ABC transporter permease LptF/LPS export ABC transporter permease LptG
MSGGVARSAALGVGLRRPGRTLVTYVLRELVPPTLMGFGLFTFFMLMNVLLDLADTIIRDRVPAADVGLLFLYNVPHVIVLTVPMGVLVGGLIAFGRMSADAEIIAMRSGGVSLYQLSLPILLLGAAASVLTFYLCVVAMPWGNNATIQHRWRLVNTRTLAGEIRPRVFETRFPNFTLFVEDVDAEQQVWHRLLLVRTDTNPSQVLMAEEARFRYSTETGEQWLELTNGYRYGGGGTAEESSVASFIGHEQHLGRTFGAGEVAPVAKSERMMNLGELRDAVAGRRARDQPVNAYLVEIHKKFAIPAACLVMALVAVPLGASTRRHTKASGYLVAIGVIAIYYMFIDGGEKFAEEGAVSPWLGVWAANLVIGAAGLLLLWNRARERDLGLVDRLLAIGDRLRHRLAAAWHRWRGETVDPNGAGRAGPGGAGEVSGPRFPRILDRYVLRQFCRVFAMTMAGLVTIWIVGEYFELSDDVYALGLGRDVLVEYFKFQMPFIVLMTIPIATILSVLVVFSLMSKQNEVVAVLAGGTSLFRLAAPALIPALVLTLVQYAIADHIAPYTNQRAHEIRASLHEGNSFAVQPSQGHWIRGTGNYLFHYADYDAERRAFQGLRVYHIDTAAWRLSRVDYATEAEWVDGRWLARDAWRRRYIYSENGARITTPELERMAATDLPISEGPEYFATEQRLPEQMSAAELREHINMLEARGFDASKYKIDLQQKFAFPAIVFVLAVVGIPFGFRMGRQGTLSGVAVALALTVMFWLTFVFFRSVGSAEILPPVVAAWAPHALFLALAGYITAGLRT